MSLLFDLLLDWFDFVSYILTCERDWMTSAYQNVDQNEKERYLRALWLPRYSKGTNRLSLPQLYCLYRGIRERNLNNNNNSLIHQFPLPIEREKRKSVQALHLQLQRDQETVQEVFFTGGIVSISSGSVYILEVKSA